MVTGLQKPPAGSEEGAEEEEEMVPVGRRLLIWAGASPLTCSQGRLCNPGPLSFRLHFTEPWMVFGTQCCKERCFPSEAVRGQPYSHWTLHYI